MKLLLLSDKESPFLWDYYKPGMFKNYDLIISCGDLKPDYLSFIVTMANVPLLYVHGNHDGNYVQTPPEGCTNIEDKIYIHNGVRILGLGGSPHYGGVPPYQYSERAMRRRITKLALKLKWAGGVDIVVAHAPAAGYGDADDYAHRGFECFNELMDKYNPKLFVHGHVHMNYGRNIPRELQRKDTKIINAYERYETEL